MWDWKEYEEYIAEMSEEDAVEMRLEDELIEPLYAVGILHDFYCQSYPFNDMPEEYEKIDGYFIAKVFFQIGIEELIQVLQFRIGEIKQASITCTAGKTES